MTREEWLEQVTRGMAPWFADLGKPLPKVRMAIGFTSNGRKGKAIGECWTGHASADGTHEILIRPDLDDPLKVAATLAHELTHAAVGVQHGHKRPFSTIAKAIGLEGKMTATTPGDTFKRNVAEILEKAGPLPHARLGFGESSGPKKQTTRLLKAVCSNCGYTVRITKKWLTEVGAPHCPNHGPMQTDNEAEDE